jgi:hypothetical protein
MLRELAQNGTALKPCISLLQFERRQQNFQTVNQLYTDFLNDKFKPGSKQHTYFLLSYLEMLNTENPVEAISYFKHSLAIFGYCKEAYTL